MAISLHPDINLTLIISSPNISLKPCSKGDITPLHTNVKLILIVKCISVSDLCFYDLQQLIVRAQISQAENLCFNAVLLMVCGGDVYISS